MVYLRQVVCKCKKTSYMLFGRKKMDTVANVSSIILNNCVLERVESTKFLGVIVDDKLNWNEHISYVSLKISQILGVFRKLKYKLPVAMLRVLYNALIYPHLSYCNIVWGCTLLSNLDKILKLQKKSLDLFLIHLHVRMPIFCLENYAFLK